MTTIISKVQELLTKQNIDAIIIGSSYNRRYVTGFTGTAGTVFITETTATFITDFRYTSQAKNQAKNYDIIENRDAVGEIAALIKKMNIKRIAFEEEHVSFKQYKMLQEKIISTLVPVSGLIEELRKVKTTEEIKKIRTAAMIADKAFEKVLKHIRPGVSEKDINHKLEMYLREAGATSSSFDVIIASGHRSALPHSVASDKLINDGDMVTLDFGALYEGYCSDMTRTAAVGEPDQQLKEVYDIVKHALDIGIKAVKHGVSCVSVDNVVRDYISSKGYGEFFGHGTGHSLGLEIHEFPYFSQKSTDILQTGMIMTVEPGIYLPNTGGVRIEDDVLVTDTGCEVLTHSPRDLIVL